MLEKNFIKRDLIKTARQCDVYKLVTASSGNISARLSNNSFLISGSGKSLGKLRKRDLSLCCMDSSKERKRGTRQARGKRPSMEHHFHRGIYKNYPHVNACLHFQSHYATILSCRAKQIYDIHFIPEAVVFLKRIEIIPYHMPGSSDLAGAVSKACQGTDIIVLRNHGQIALGTDLEDVLKKAEYFELACKMIFLDDKNIKRYGNKDIVELIKHYGN